MRNLFLAALPLWIVLTSGCGLETLETSGQTEGTDEEDIAVAEQPEVWSSDDDPAIFTRSTRGLERRAALLPASGEARVTPWTGSYWPTTKDSINFRWAGAGSDSAAKKYGLAFGVDGVEDQVSRRHGIDSVTDAKGCKEDKECEDGELCAKRSKPGSAGRCVPKWYGICHGWAAAAILFPEPEQAVVKNGVTFEVQDVKALLSLVHNATASRFVSLRCNDRDKTGDITYDEHGRPTPACRDTNAGTFHLLLTNFIGIRRQSFIEDRIFDQQVWNQPIRAYEVVEQRTVGEVEAHRLIGVRSAGVTEVTGYRFNPDAVSFSHVKTDLAYIKEATATTAGNLSAEIDHYTKVIRYEYVLELDADGEIIGGEWAGDSKRNHPDFLWLPLSAMGTTVAGGAISYGEVEALAKASVTP